MKNAETKMIASGALNNFRIPHSAFFISRS